MTPAELKANLVMLRECGVKSFVDVAGGGFSVEFWPVAAETKADVVEKPSQDDRCNCGHAHYEHNAGLCMLGCDPLKCSPEKAP